MTEQLARFHHVQRTSPKGEPFVGTCTLCGMTGLTARAALERCENPRRLTDIEAMTNALTGVPTPKDH